MKKNIVLVVFLSFFNLFSQNIEVTYVKGYKNYKDKSNLEPKILKGINYKLQVLNDEAVFKYIPSMNVDGNNKNFIKKGGGDGVYYKNNKKNEKIHQVFSPLSEKLYLIKSDNQNIKWKLTNEQKKINNYTCFKVIGEKKFINPLNNKEETVTIVAWYTPEINCSFGPSGYDGLPGLVLEAKTASFYFIADRIKFNVVTKIQKPIKGILVTEREYDNILMNELKHFKL